MISRFILLAMIKTVLMDVIFMTGENISFEVNTFFMLKPLHDNEGLISRCIAVFSSFHLVDPFVF